MSISDNPFSVPSTPGTPSPGLPPSEALYATFIIRCDSSSETASCFILRAATIQYIITSKIFLEKNEFNEKTIQLFYQNEWRDYSVEVVEYSKNDEADFAILYPNKELATRGVMQGNLTNTGEEVNILGYPSNYLSNSPEIDAGHAIPVIEKAVVNNISSQFSLNIHNKSGFAGGPVILSKKMSKYINFDYVVGIINYDLSKNNIVATKIKIVFDIVNRDALRKIL